MIFSPEYMAPNRLLNPLASPYGCHASEIYFLCGAVNMNLEQVYGDILPQTKVFDYLGHKVYAINKNIGDQTCLVVNAPETPYLEAMVINPQFETTIDSYNNVRYLCSGAYYTFHGESSLTQGLERMNQRFPDYVGLYSATLIGALKYLGIPVGRNFGANMDGMHTWMKSQHLSILQNSWPY